MNLTILQEILEDRRAWHITVQLDMTQQLRTNNKDADTENGTVDRERRKKRVGRIEKAALTVYTTMCKNTKLVVAVV